MEQKVIRAGTLVIIGALLLRLLSGSSLGSRLTLSPKAAALMVFLQTGRPIRPAQITFTPQPEETTGETQPPPQTDDLPVFSPQEAENIAIFCGFDYTADLPALLTQPLEWDLTGDEPTVLIVHSHATESFSPASDYQQTTPYHTLDTQYNMISVGAYVAQLLEAGGVSVIQDTTLHDDPSYNAAYGNSRKSVEDYLKTYPSIRLVLDLHRDSFEDEEGNQIVQTVFSQNETYAPLMFVVGTSYSGREHPAWRENLSLALKLQTQIEGLCPGICRKINLRSERFNQDLSPGALLVEVGASGNSYEEVRRSAKMLAEGILTLARGSR